MIQKWLDADWTRYGFHLHCIPLTIRGQGYTLPSHKLQIWCLWGMDAGINWRGKDLLFVRLGKDKHYGL